MRATTINLYAPGAREDGYRGCWHIPCPDDDPRLEDLAEVNCGRFLDEDGAAHRSFFFADEIDEMIARAERETGCAAEADEDWPYPHPDPPLSAAEESRQEINEHLERRSR